MSPLPITSRYLPLVFIVTILWTVFITQQCIWAAAPEKQNSSGNRTLSIDSSDIESRLVFLERQIQVLSAELGRNRTTYNIASEARQLASDAWDIAVDARAIAVRAEDKANRLQKDQTR